MTRPFEFAELIERERKERLELWGKQFAESHDVEPVYIDDVDPGSICRLWWMPNQTRFVVAGPLRDKVQIVHPTGTVSAFLQKTLVVILDEPPASFEYMTLLDRIESFERGMSVAAWAGRDPETENYF